MRVCVCVCVCQRPKTVGMDYSCIEYMRNIMQVLDVWLLLHHLFSCRHITKFTFRAYIV